MQAGNAAATHISPVSMPARQQRGEAERITTALTKLSGARVWHSTRRHIEDMLSMRVLALAACDDGTTRTVDAAHEGNPKPKDSEPHPQKQVKNFPQGSAIISVCAPLGLLWQV